MSNNLKSTIAPKTQKLYKTIKRLLLKSLSIILIVSLLYCGFVGVFFFTIPRFYEDSEKVSPYYGYSHPLNTVTDNANYTIIYHTGEILYSKEKHWVVIDDQEAIRRFKDTFVVYYSIAGSTDYCGRFFYLYRNERTVLDCDLTYFPHCLIFDDFFEPYKKYMDREEVFQYAKEHNFSIMVY